MKNSIELEWCEWITSQRLIRFHHLTSFFTQVANLDPTPSLRLRIAKVIEHVDYSPSLYFQSLSCIPLLPLAQTYTCARLRMKYKFWAGEQFVWIRRDAGGLFEFKKLWSIGFDLVVGDNNRGKIMTTLHTASEKFKDDILTVKFVSNFSNRHRMNYSMLFIIEYFVSFKTNYK